MPRSSTDELGLSILYSQWIILVMSFSCYFILKMQLISMSLTMVHMVNWTVVEKKKHSDCFSNYTEDYPEPGKFEWNHIVQSQILASAMYGMAIWRIPAELIAKILNYKWLPVLGTCMSSLCTFLIPLFAKINPQGHLLIVLQILKSMAQAVIRPSFCLLIEQWLDKDSVQNYVSYAEIGYPLSGFVTVLGAGFLCNTEGFGWESVFYVSGSFGVLWCLIWIYLVWDYCYPTPLISGSEPPVSKRLQNKRIPWSCILTSSCFWAYVLVGMAFYWQYSLNILLIPMYLKRVFNVDLRWNSFASAVPNLLQAFILIIAIFVTERFVQRKVFEKVVVRKFCVISGLSMYAASSILLTWTECDKFVSSVVLMIGIGFIGFTLSALINLPLDMSPRFTGILSGIMNSIGAFTGSFLPLLVAFLSESEHGIGRWYKIFNACTLWSVVALIIFLAFGSSDVQYWDHFATIHPKTTRTLKEKSTSYNLVSRSQEIIVPESSRLSLKSASVVDKDALSELLQADAMTKKRILKEMK